MKFRSLPAGTRAAFGAALLCAALNAAAADPTAAPAQNTAPAQDATPRKAVTRCEPVTGSRILPSAADHCKSAVRPYRSYTQEELQRTGETDLSAALRKIDPVFR
jgi:hypothetical protein